MESDVFISVSKHSYLGAERVGRYSLATLTGGRRRGSKPVQTDLQRGVALLPHKGKVPSEIESAGREGCSGCLLSPLELPQHAAIPCRPHGLPLRPWAAALGFCSIT